MAESTTSNSKQSKFVRKSGRTILVQILDNNNFNSSLLDNLEGLKSNHFTEKSQSHFLTFDNLVNSESAFQTLKNDYSESIRVKFAHYKIFFTLQGLNNNSDYSNVKTQHINYISENLNGNVLYYKLYRKNDNYLECGDLTLDTKETFDHLINPENQHRNFELNVDNHTLSGSHFRYNRRSKNENNELNTSNSL